MRIKLQAFLTVLGHYKSDGAPAVHDEAVNVFAGIITMYHVGVIL